MSKLIIIIIQQIEELEESLQSPGDATALEVRLENTRAERSELEARVAELQEQLSRAQGEVIRLRDSANSLQEECKVCHC
jgi:chromosome segregation ATPase